MENQAKRFKPVWVFPLLYILGMGVSNLIVRQVYRANYVDAVYIRSVLPFLTALAVFSVICSLTVKRQRASESPKQGNVLLFLFLFLPLAGLTLYYWALRAQLSTAFFLPLAVALLVGVGEELMFRYILFGGLLRAQGQSFRNAVLFSAALFSLLHSVNILAGMPLQQMLIQMGTTFLAGLFFALMYDYTKSIFLMIVFHGLWDYLLISDAAQVIPSFGSIFLVLSILQILLIPVLVIRKHRLGAAEERGIS